MYGNAKDTDIKKLISNVLIGQSYKHCKFCLGEINEFCSLADEVQLDPQQGGEPITMAEILTSIFGSTLQDQDVELLCMPCAQTAVNCYRFIEMGRNSERLLHKLFTSLVECLEPTEEHAKTETMYLLLNQNNHEKIVFDRTTRVRDTHEAHRRLRVLLTYKVKNMKKKIKRKIATAAVKWKPFQCRECGMQLSGKSELKTHKERGHGNLINCESCCRSFSSKNKLKAHHERAHTEKTLPCTHCPKLFGSQNILKEHIKIAHTGQCVCEQCGKWYGNPKALRHHEEAHRNKTCELCKKSYKHKESFLKHLERCALGLPDLKKLRNEPLEMFTCDICGIQYKHKGTIAAHIKLHHTNAKAFVCDWCGKRFMHRSSLTGHIVTHTGERKHNCEICGGFYVTKTALTYHMRIHTGVKPYVCAECGERFLSASRRLEHMKRKHLGPSIECHICYRKFERPFKLKEHLKKHMDPMSRLNSTRRDIR